MAKEGKKGKVLHQIEGYRIRQMKDGEKYTGKFGVYAGKYPVNEEKGYETYDDALNTILKIVSGEIKSKKINKNKR